MNVKTFASDSSGRKYKKYFVLLPQHYDKLKSSAIDLKNLSKDEIEMVAILRNSKLSPVTRLKLYQQVLFRMLNKRATLSADASLNRINRDDGRGPAVFSVDAPSNHHSPFGILNDDGRLETRARARAKTLQLKQNSKLKMSGG